MLNTNSILQEQQRPFQNIADLGQSEVIKRENTEGAIKKMNKPEVLGREGTQQMLNNNSILQEQHSPFQNIADSEQSGVIKRENTEGAIKKMFNPEVLAKLGTQTHVE